MAYQTIDQLTAAGYTLHHTATAAANAASSLPASRMLAGVPISANTAPPMPLLACVSVCRP